jgi:hypothetical protein
MNNLWSKKLYFYNIFLLLLISVLSCNTHRKIIKQPIKEKGADYLFEKLKKNEFQFDWFSAKFSADFEEINKKKIFVRGQIRIKKDSVIWISISSLGLEIVRFYITNDVIRFIDRYNSTYIVADFNYFNNLFDINMDFDILQSLIVGNDFSYYENNKFKAHIDNKQYKLSTVNRRKLKKYIKNNNEKSIVLVQDMWLNPESFKITNMTIKEIKKNQKFKIIYSDFNQIQNKYLPNQINFNIFNIKDERITKISLKYSKITLNKPLTFPFKIPKKYTKMK